MMGIVTSVNASGDRRAAFLQQAMGPVGHSLWQITGGKFVVFLIAVASWSTPPFLVAQMPDCREERMFSGQQYWFWEGYLGVQDLADVGNDRKGTLVSDPNICFRVPLFELTNEMARTLGYKLALEQWMKRLTRDPKKWDKDSQIVSARHKVEALTGEHFASLSDLRNWWKDSADYLIWSEEQKRLTVDNGAKRQGRPILPLYPMQPIEPELYWFYSAMGWLKEIKREGGNVQGVAWDGHKEIKIITGESFLQDAASKQRGYLKAVALIIEDRFAIPAIGTESVRKLVHRLQELTGQTYNDRESWIRWWREKKGKLRLSEDGNRLVPEHGN